MQAEDRLSSRTHGRCELCWVQGTEGRRTGVVPGTGTGTVPVPWYQGTSTGTAGRLPGTRSSRHTTVVE